MAMGNFGELSERIAEYVDAHHLIDSEDRILIACSGGADSVAMLISLCELRKSVGCRLGVAHLDHGIREEAQSDSLFVENMAKQLNLPFYIESADIPKYAQENGFSLEQAAREYRYNFLQETASKHNYNKIAVGHNRDDNVETVLLNFLRGCGVSGLKGIKPINDNIIRPLLDIPAVEIREYLNRAGIGFVEDTSNKDIKFTRNKIRHNLLPYLKKHFNPSIDDSLSRLSLISREIDEHLSEEAIDAVSKLLIDKDKSKIILDLSGFLRYHISVRRSIIREVIKAFGKQKHPSDFQSVERLLELCRLGRIGKVAQFKDVAAEIIGGAIVFGTLTEASLKKVIELPGRYGDKSGEFTINGEIIKATLSKDEYITENENTAYLDYDKFENPAIIRNAREGDKFKPLGMKGHKKVFDLLAERKIPSFQKRSKLVLISGGKIAWVVGIRISDDFKINSNTKRILKIEYAE